MDLVLSRKNFHDGKLLPYIVKKEGKKLTEGNFAIYYFHHRIVTSTGSLYKYKPLKFAGKLAMFCNRSKARDYAEYQLAIDWIMKPTNNYLHQIMNKDQVLMETEHYSDIPLETYQMFEWYAAQMELTVDYLLDEFSINGVLITPRELVEYDYECDSWAAVH